MGERNFEQQWRDAFEGVEITPSEKVWTAIESAIANQEAARYKKGLIYYRWLAAAVLLMFLSLLGYLGFQGKLGLDSDPSVVTVEETVQGTPREGGSLPQETLEPTTGIEGPQSVQEAGNLESLADGAVNGDPDELLAGSPTSTDPPLQEGVTGQQEEIHTSAAISPKDQHTFEEEFKERGGVLTDGERQNADGEPGTETGNLATLNEAVGAEAPGSGRKGVYSALALLSPGDVSREEITLSALPDHVYGVPVLPVEQQVKSETGLWAGIKLAPGYFNPNYQGLTAVTNSANPQTVNSFQRDETNKTGFSWSLGFDVGIGLSDKWELSSGIQYYDHQVQSSTNGVLDNRTPLFSSVIESKDLADSRGTVSFSPVDLDNNFQFLSIPLQAGYRVLDGRVQLMINSGIAADIFLKNEIIPSDASLETVTIRPGSGAPFRTVYFNGLIGAEAVYEFIPQYSISLQPRYRIALNHFTKPDINYSSLPSSFGMGVGIKYTFK